MRDLAPGGVLTADDVELATRQASTVPPTALRGADGLDEAVGRETAVLLTPGQVLTEALVGAGRPADLAPDDTVVVPVRLPDTAEMLHAGDRVDLLAPPEPDVLGAGTDDPEDTEVLARGALVLPRTTDVGASGSGLLSSTPETTTTLLVAVSPSEAPALATASRLAAVFVP